RVRACLFFVGDLHPIGGGAADNFDGSAAGELVKPRLSAAGFDTQVCGNFGAAARLNGDGGSHFQELGAALPEFRVHQIAAVHPADDAGSSADLYVFVVAGKHIHVVVGKQATTC